MSGCYGGSFEDRYFESRLLDEVWGEDFNCPKCGTELEEENFCYSCDEEL